MANDSASIRNATVTRAANNQSASANAVDTNAIRAGLKNGCGMNGAPDPAVNVLQQALNEQNGAGLKCDGRFGPKTEAAVRAFQEKNGIEPSGTICPQTLAKLQGKEAPTVDTPKVANETAPANEASTPAEAQTAPKQPVKQPASQQDVEQSRSKMKSREELMRARVAAAEKAENEGQQYDVVTDRNVQAALDGVQQAKGSVEDQRRQVGQTRLAVQNDIRALAGKKNRTDAEEMLLTGKRQQDEVLGQLERHLDTKKKILDAAGEAVSDGVITERENDGISIASERTQRMEEVLAVKARVADQVVATAEGLGGRVPARDNQTPTPNATVDPEVTTPGRTQPRRGLTNQPRVANETAVPNQSAETAAATTTATTTATTKAEENFAQLSDSQVNTALNQIRQGAAPTKGGIAKDAQKILGAFEGMSPNQVKQVQDAYEAKNGAGSFQKDVVGSLYPHNQRALATLSDTKKTQAERTAEFTKLRNEGRTIDQKLKADATAIREAVRGMGTDEQKLFDTLGKYADNKEQRDLLFKEYTRQFPGRDLRADVRDDVGGDEAVRANALMDGKRPLANAGYANEVLRRGDLKELTRHLNSIPAADRAAFASAFQQQYGASLASTVEASTRGRYVATGDMAKLLDAVKAFK